MTWTRRELFVMFGAAAATLRGAEGPAKPIRGVFPIMATPFTEAKAIDYDDLAKEVDFMDHCGVHGMVWPQLASEYWLLTKDERMRGMQLLAKSIRGRKPALVLGVQGPNTEAMLEYARYAETLEPDAMIAIPPAEAKTLDDFRNYYRALGRVTKRPVFVQTSGGAKNIEPKVDTLVELAREFPNVAYIKEEYPPVLDRMRELAKHRPEIKGVFSGNHGKGWTYEMRIGSDGTCPGSALSDLYVRIWDLHQAGQIQKALDVFSRLLLMINLEEQIPGTFSYLMKRRGVFKTEVSRKRDSVLAPEAIAEIEATWALLKPDLRVSLRPSVALRG